MHATVWPRITLGLLPGLALLGVLAGCQKEGAVTDPAPAKPAASTAPAPATKPAPLPPRQKAPGPSRPVSWTSVAPAEAHGDAGRPNAATPATSGATPPAATTGPQEEEGTVLRVRRLRGGRTTFSSAGIQQSRNPASYEVQVGLPDGTRFSFLPLKNVLTKGSKVVVRYVLKDGRRTRPELPVAVPKEPYRISAEVLPPLRPTPIGDGTFAITFPNTPSESRTDLGMLYRYDYHFSKSYQPDTYYFFRLSAAGSGQRKFFQEQAASLLALAGGQRIAVLVGGVKRDRRTGLPSTGGRFTLHLGYTPVDGRIQLWFDSKKKVLYGAWMHAYSTNQLLAEREMQQDFFGSFTLKPPAR